MSRFECLPDPEFPLEPIDGVVQPPFLADPQKKRRNTNQLQFLGRVLAVLLKHKYVAPFRRPVNTIKLNVPDYYQIIKHPMDFGTIRKRINNCYYYSASECIQDFATVFINCYRYNRADDDIVLMAHTLQQLFAQKIQDMPEEEIEIPLMPIKGKRRRKSKHANKNKGRPNMLGLLPVSTKFFCFFYR